MAGEAYYVRARGKVSGPYNVDGLQKLAKRGLLSRIHEISSDRVGWAAASEYEDLFPQSTPNRGEAASVRSPVAVPEEQDTLQCPICGGLFAMNQMDQSGVCKRCARPRPTSHPSAPSPPQPVTYYSRSPATNCAADLRRRTVAPFGIVAALMFATSGVVAVNAYLGSGFASSTELAVSIGGTCAFLLLAIPALVLWLVWLHRAHQDIRSISAGSYTISPGKAVGFSFIPLFDAFWVVYMPCRLSAELNRHLEELSLPRVATGAVMVSQIFSVISAPIFPGLTPLLYAVSMWQVQRGLNRLYDALN